MWGPRYVRREGPLPLRNVVAQNKKVPLTPIEETLQLTPGAGTGADAIENVRPYRLPGTKARISFATSLPAFMYGYELGMRPPPLDPCSDTANYYMPCLDRLGTNLVMQDEANPGPWAAQGGQGAWQPLEWMGSTWRAVADPTVGFDYNVTPHMVGNLADLAFDGQTAITQRGLRGPRRCTYVGNRRAAARGPAAVSPLRRAEAPVPRSGPVGSPRRAARRRCARPPSASRRLRRPARERLPGDGGDRRPAVPARPPPPQLPRRAAPALEPQ